MADRLECVVAWCDGEPFAIVDEQLEDEDGPDPAEVRMVELHPWETIVTREQAGQYAGFRHVEPGGRVLTAEEWLAVASMLERMDRYGPGVLVGDLLDAIPASLLAAAKEAKP